MREKEKQKVGRETPAMPWQLKSAAEVGLLGKLEGTIQVWPGLEKEGSDPLVGNSFSLVKLKAEVELKGSENNVFK